MADKVTDVDLREPVAQKQKLVGDEAVYAEVHEVKPEVVNEQATAQVSPPREAADGKVNVHETVVHLDRVITDPSSPLAVQIPDAGRGDLALPIHRLDAPTVEQRFSEDASKADDGDEPKKS
jgi:hypothetical protein